MDIVNLYEILKVDRTCSHKDIKKAYKKLVMSCHPDKGGSTVEFELLTTAYTVLGNKNERMSYDKLFEKSEMEKINNNDWYEMKKSSEKMKKQKNETEISKEKAKILFDEYMKEENNKNNNEIFDYNELQKNIDILNDQRKQQTRETMHENIFGDNFDINEFNDTFEKIYKKHHELIPYTGDPMAWNIDSKYGTLDDFGKLYEENENDVLYNNDYGSLNIFDQRDKKITKKEIKKINNKKNK